MMSDINVIQKINATSKELKNFGFADSMQDSFSQARSIYTSEEDKSSNASVSFGSQSEATEALSYNFKKYKDMTDSRMKKMGEQISELQEYVKQLLSRQQPVRQQVSQPQPVQQEREIPRQQETRQESVQQKPASSQQSKNYNQRQGSFTPDDVKIEDIFYFGNKR